MVASEQVDRFRLATESLLGGAVDGRLALAVSGGPDSLAMLLLAGAAFPGRVEAATFDHGLRTESAGEAEFVGEVCASLGVSHRVLPASTRLDSPKDRIGLQALARAWRYAALERWCRDEGLHYLLTAHHADDQAETVLMRLARGSGVAGLSGIRPRRTLDQNRRIVVLRPLLRFTKGELIAIVHSAGIDAVDDPSNRDARYDRTHARIALQRIEWLLPERLAAVASHMRDADTALDWAARQEWDRRAAGDGHIATFRSDGLPDELLRRLTAMALEIVEGYATAGGEIQTTGPELSRLVDTLKAGGTGTLRHVKATGGELWRFVEAPPRR